MAKFEIGDIIQGCTLQTKKMIYLIIDYIPISNIYSVFCINHNDKQWIGKKWKIPIDHVEIDVRYKKVD